MCLWLLIWPDSPSQPGLECQFVPCQEVLFPLQHNPQIWHMSPVLWGQHSCSFQWPSDFCLFVLENREELQTRSPGLLNCQELCVSQGVSQNSHFQWSPPSAPDYHLLLPFCFKYTEIEKPLFLHVDSSSCTEGVEIYLWSAGFSFPSSVPSQTSPCLLAKWQSEKQRRSWCFGSAAQQ